LKKNENLLLEIKDFPVMQNLLYFSPEEARCAPTGQVKLVQNSKTGLIYNSDFDSSLLVYDEAYTTDQSNSKAFRSHLDNVAGIIIRNASKLNIVEIGCGKGFFLNLLRDSGINAFGFDPSYSGSSCYAKKSYFDEIMLRSADFIVMRHVLEHIKNPYDFLVHLKSVAINAQKVYIEVPSFDWILDNRSWCDIYYEHVNYFRLKDFCSLFDDVHESGYIFNGQYIYIVANIESLRLPDISIGGIVSFPDSFYESLEATNNAHKSELAIAWGAASKGVIFSIMRERIGLPLNALVDINADKQNKYAPLSGLEVISPEEALENYLAGTTCFVMNNSYEEEIRNISQNKFNYIGVL
jgi:hypothetical protein